METFKDLGAAYQKRFSGVVAYRDTIWKILIAHFFQQYIRPSDTVLDLGAGWGEFIRNVHARHRIAMDLNDDMPARVGPGVQTIVQDCSAPWQLAPETVDVVFTSNFFEHLPSKDALRQTLQEAERCLKIQGYLICLGPNIRVVHGAYWDFWDHYLPLSDRTIIEILELLGFKIERVIPRFLPYSMSQGFRPPIGAVRWYLRLPFLWRVFGKQFLVVARKAG